MHKIAPVLIPKKFLQQTFAHSQEFADANNNNLASPKDTDNLKKLHDKTYGKVWVAKGKLEQNALLFNRECLVVFPRRPSPSEMISAQADDKDESINVCLACYQLTKSLCPLCGWPLHQVQCRKDSVQQHTGECQVLQKNHVDFKDHNRALVYELVAILRMCLTKYRRGAGDAATWNNLLRLKPESRKADFKYENQMKNFILGSCKLRFINETQISDLVAVLHANRFAIDNRENRHPKIFGSFILAKTKDDLEIELFPFPHSCSPNTAMRYSQQCVTVSLLKPVKQNEMLTINYLDLPGTLEWLSQSDRKQNLKRRRYMKPCPCNMCKVRFSSKILLPDIDEDELRPSRALKCMNCQEGYMYLSPRQTKWTCKNKACKEILERRKGLEIEVAAAKHLTPNDCIDIGNALKKITMLSQKRLHPYHRILHRKSLELMKSIADTFLYIIAYDDVATIDMNAEAVENICKLCRRVFQVEFELSRKSNQPSFALVLSIVFGTYLEFLIAADKIAAKKTIGNLPEMISEMVCRMFIGLKILYKNYFTEGAEKEFCLRLTNNCYRRVKGVTQGLTKFTNSETQ